MGWKEEENAAVEGYHGPGIILFGRASFGLRLSARTSPSILF
jgi:hypothetical protein